MAKDLFAPPTSEELLGLDNESDVDMFSPPTEDELKSIDSLQETPLPKPLIPDDGYAAVEAGLVHLGQKAIENKLPAMAEEAAFRAIGGKTTGTGIDISEKLKETSLLPIEKQPFVKPSEIGREALDSGLIDSKMGLPKARVLKNEYGGKLGNVLNEIDEKYGDFVNLKDFENKVETSLKNIYGDTKDVERIKTSVFNKLYGSPEIKQIQEVTIPAKEVITTGIMGEPIKTMVPGKVSSVTSAVPKKVSLTQLEKYKQVIQDIGDSENISNKVKKSIARDIREFSEESLAKIAPSSLVDDFKNAKKDVGRLEETLKILREESLRQTKRGSTGVGGIVAKGMGGVPSTVAHAATLAAKIEKPLAGITAGALNMLDKAIKSPVGKIAWKSLPVLTALGTYQSARAEGLDHGDALKQTVIIEGAESIPILGQVIKALKPEQIEGGEFEEERKEIEEPSLRPEQIEGGEFEEERKEIEEPSRIKKLQNNLDTLNKLKKPVNQSGAYEADYNMSNEKAVKKSDEFKGTPNERYSQQLEKYATTTSLQKKRAILFALSQEKEFRSAMSGTDKNKGKGDE